MLRPDKLPSAANGVAEAIAREELTGLAYMFWARLIAIAILAGWALTLPFERSGFYLLALAAFALLGASPYLLARWGIGGLSVTAAFLLLDAGLLSYLLIVPTPYAVDGWPPQLSLRLWNFLWLGVFLVGMALTYSPALVIWTGIASIVAWSAGFLWVANLPDSIPHTSRDMLDRGLSAASVLSRILDPRAVSLTTLQYQIVFLVLVTMILTLTVWRSRRLVRRQVAAELARARSRAISRPISCASCRPAAGRSIGRRCSRWRCCSPTWWDLPGLGVSFSRRACRIVARVSRTLGPVVFAHDGTVDKYIGDAIMVHFGTPRPQQDDPVRALACAAAMIAEIGRWNAERERAGEAPIGIGIGVHYGEVLVGNIGDARRLEYTVLGDTVNVASRLEGLTRETGTSLVVSDDLVRAVHGCGVEPSSLVEDLRPDQTRAVRGRREPIAIWCAARR